MVDNSKELEKMEDDSDVTSKSPENEKVVSAKGHKRLAPESNAKPIKTYITPNYTINGIDVQNFFEDINFNDIVGLDNDKNNIKDRFVNEVDCKFNELLGIPSKKFILLSGVSETGILPFVKTISNEYKKFFKDNDIPFFDIKPKTIVDSEEGQSEKNIIAVFDFAKQFEHCILFFDTFDELVPNGAIYDNDYQEKIKSRTNTFLQMVNGLDNDSRILIIAATKNLEKVDQRVLSYVNEKFDITN